MKLKALILFPGFTICASGATTINLQNTAGTLGGYPIVDNAGVPIPVANSKFQVGTFTPVFASILGSLDPFAGHAPVIEAFTPSGDVGVFSRPGLFNTVIGGVDEGGALGSAGAPLFVLVTYTPTGGAPQAIVFKPNFGNFPMQDEDGNAFLNPPRWLNVSDVIFGETSLVPVDLSASGYPNAFMKAEFSQGITFRGIVIIPEPSTCLLMSFSVLCLGARRRPLISRT